jgi:hypothetical protein
MCSQNRSRIWYRASLLLVDTLSTCSTSKRRSAAFNDRDVLPCAPGTEVDPGTRHHVRQCTQCPIALPVSVGLLLGMTETCCHVFSVLLLNLVQGISFVIGHTVHLLYQKAWFCCLNFQGIAVLCSGYRNRTWYRTSRSSKTQCQSAIPVRVGQLLAMTGTNYNVLPVPE